jgi:hypothetical protein
MKLIGDSTGEESTSDEVDLIQEIQSLTLQSILSKIFCSILFDNLKNNYLMLKFEESEDIVNNEIMTWVSTLESIYPAAAK